MSRSYRHSKEYETEILKLSPQNKNKESPPKKAFSFFNELQRLYLNQRFSLGTNLNRFDYAAALDAVAETGGSRAVVGYRLDKLIQLVDKGVLIADDVTGRPPRLHVGMAALACLNQAEALKASFVVGGVVLQLVHPLEGEFERALVAVDFD